MTDRTKHLGAMIVGGGYEPIPDGGSELTPEAMAVVQAQLMSSDRTVQTHDGSSDTETTTAE